MTQPSGSPSPNPDPHLTLALYPEQVPLLLHLSDEGLLALLERSALRDFRKGVMRRSSLDPSGTHSEYLATPVVRTGRLHRPSEQTRRASLCCSLALCIRYDTHSPQEPLGLHEDSPGHDVFVVLSGDLEVSDEMPPRGPTRTTRTLSLTLTLTR